MGQAKNRYELGMGNHRPMAREWVDRRTWRVRVESWQVASALREVVQTRRDPRAEVITRAVHRSPEALVASAVRHGVAGYLWATAVRLTDSGVVDVLDRVGLSTIRQEQFGRQVRLGAELVTIGHALDQAGIPWAAIKGPVLAELVHGRPDLRTSVDLDLLVSPDRLVDAVECLEAQGSVLLERNWPALRKVLPGELHMKSPAGTPIDLHWHVVHEARARADAAMSTDLLLARTREVVMSGGAVPTLDPVDTLLHLCVHAALSGGDRLIWLVDIDRALVAADLDLSAQRAISMRVGPAVELMLRRTRNCLGSPVGDEYLRSLVPEYGWRWASAASAAAPPVHRARGGGSVAHLVARATRADARSSEIEMLRRTQEWLRNGATADSSRSTNWWDESNPSSMMFDAGEPDGLARFAETVCAESARSRQGRP